MAVKYWYTDPALTWANAAQQWTLRDYSLEIMTLASRNKGASGGTDYSGTFYTPSAYDDILMYLSVTARSGTTPTITVTYQVSPDHGSTWYDHTAFTQIADTTGNEVKLIDNPGQCFRFKYVIGGTATPTYTFSVEIEGKSYRGIRK